MATPLPDTIGRYKILEILGQGGMGVVYLAEDPRLKRKVAIKVIRKDAKDNTFDDTLERFNREAEISARLNHSNIITVFDVGEDAEAGVFLAMEYVQGQSLATYIRRHRPGPEAGLTLLIQAMRAMEAAAREGIIHRDIKPENMLVSQAGRLKLMDFGLARGDESRITATGVMLGTPSFSAPEIIEGREPTLETDRYAFAVTAFEVILGELPFLGHTLGVTLYNVVKNPPTFPEGTSADLMAVFERALAKRPEDRFPDLGTFMTALIGACPIPPGIREKFLAKLEPAEPMDARPAPTPAEVRAEEPTLLHAPKPTAPKTTPGPRAPMPKVSLPRLPLASPVPKPMVTPQAAPQISMDRLLKGLRPHTPAPAPLSAPPPGRTGFRPAPEPPPEVEAAPFDPFDGVDWEAVLAEPEVPPVRENLVGDLEAGIQDADVLLAETRMEEEEVRADLRALESGVRKWNPAELMAAGERTQQVDLRKVLPP